MNVFTLVLTEAEVQLVFNCVVKQPFEQVVALVNNLNAQVSQQKNPPPVKKEPEAPPATIENG